MSLEEIQPWLFEVEPAEGESLSHYLGRFRQENGLTATGSGRETGLGALVGRWERFYLNPHPTEAELAKLAVTVNVPVTRLWAMLLPPGVAMQHQPVRLCAACYAETPVHQIAWQLQSADRCDRHQLRLLSECPHCKARFPRPAAWAGGQCSRCATLFLDLVAWQKSVEGS